MTIMSWIQSFGWFTFSSSHADELEKIISLRLQRVQELKQNVDKDAVRFAQEKANFQLLYSQLNGYREQVFLLEQSSAQRLPQLEALEGEHRVHIDKIVQAASLALVPASVTALKKELDSSMKEYVAAGIMLQDAFGALEKLEKEALTNRG